MLELNAEAKARLREFHNQGGVWLVNAALLHPRGWALTLHYSETGEPIGMSIAGDGKDPWYFPPGSVDNTIRDFEIAEADRERN